MGNDEKSLHPERTTSSWREEPDPQALDAGVTWMPSTAHGVQSSYEEAMLPTTVFAFPKHRKLPLIDAESVQAAMDEFFDVDNVDDDDRTQAFANIQAAAKYYEVAPAADSWQNLPR
jgi:hypothetical protein